MLDFGIVGFLSNLIIFSDFTKEYSQESQFQPKVEFNANLREMSEDFNFKLENYRMLHHGFVHNINIDVRYQYVKGIANGQYPDFLKLEEDIKQFLGNYPNETDYWEIINKELAKMLLVKYPQLSSITLKIDVPPDVKVARPRSSTVTLTRYQQ
ncbi:MULTISPECIES: hypothetical protein [Nostocales]|uniref:Dihydroneopterin aldolase n=3 Tax=Nostocales TaxID=1161 RepID=A0A8S9T9U2_9CYAN|nr:hypothetical protein [Tolypothrix bouteillei]KAF3888223.1 hypothetical protein DA73_0400024065 [Tolypothrix bouteillei VB521301]